MNTALPQAATNSRIAVSAGSPVDGLLVEDMDDEVLVLDRAAGRIHQFNHSAGIVWKGLMLGQTADEITDAIVARFDVLPERARQDTRRIISQLKKLKLVTGEDAA